MQLEFELLTEQGMDELVFRTPQNQGKAPPGYWMLFLVTTAGTPSLATWVQLA